MEEKKPEEDSKKQLQRRDFLKIAGAGAAAHFVVLNALGGKAWGLVGGFCGTQFVEPPDLCLPPMPGQSADVCEPHIGNLDHCGQMGGPWPTPVPDLCNPGGHGPGPITPDICDPVAGDPDDCERNNADEDLCDPPDEWDSPDGGPQCEFPISAADVCVGATGEFDQCNMREPVDLDHCGEIFGFGVPLNDYCNTAYFDEDKCGQQNEGGGTIYDTCDPVANDPDLCNEAFADNDLCDPAQGPADSCNQSLQVSNTDHCGEIHQGSGQNIPDTCRPRQGDPDRCGQMAQWGAPVPDTCSPPPEYSPDLCDVAWEALDICEPAPGIPDFCEEILGGANTDHCGEKLADGVTPATDFCAPIVFNADRCGYQASDGSVIPDVCDPGADDPDMCDQPFGTGDECDPQSPADTCDQNVGDTDHCGEWLNGVQIGGDTCVHPVTDPDYGGPPPSPTATPTRETDVKQWKIYR